MWKRLDCYDDTVETFYNFTSNNLDPIINSSSKKYKNAVTKFKEVLVNLKETLDEIKNFYMILAKYNVKRNINSDETFEDEFIKVIIDLKKTMK